MRLSPISLSTVALASSFSSLSASYLDDIGLTELRARLPGLDGSGVIVGQVEAGSNWQTDPADSGQDSSLFTYFELSTPYPDGSTYDASKQSEHANRVGALLYGLPTGTKGYDGIAPGIAAIEAFAADYYYSSAPANDSIVRASTRTPTQAKVVNQSFVFTTLSSFIDEDYDDYSALYNVILCNGIFTDANNNPEITTLITSPASSYNCIAVGVVDDVNLTPLADGRSKPDIVAPSNGGLANFTSYTTPIVSGAAALLVQSGSAGAGGNGTSESAIDARTIKALILNSATKTESWTNSSTRPLDVINGAGILNINRAQQLLASGRYSETEDDIVTDSGASHNPPTEITTELPSNTGWNLSTLTNTFEGRIFRTYFDATDHYFFECQETEASSFNLTATLVWNRNFGRSNINDLDLFLYTASGSLIASSVSTVDNVEHIYELDLPPGRYVLQVHKPENGRDSLEETYALAFDFAPGRPVAASAAVATTASSDQIDLSWSDNSDNESGFRIERRIGSAAFSEIATVNADGTAYSDSNLIPGTTYEYQIIAINEFGDAEPATTSATTYSDQEQWRLDNFGSTEASGDATDTADPDKDGQNNLVEFATGSDPNAPNPQPLQWTPNPTNREFSFTWRQSAEITFSIGYTEDLTLGFTFDTATSIDAGANLNLEPISQTPIDDELTERTYGIRESVNAPKGFIQLQITSQ